ncbi:MAG: hypothetical protein H6772_02535 [Pseudomonadales bacterium]|nr:hypothetical protein [Pseudomonadales bacterium]
MSWPMIYGPLAATFGPTELFNFDFEEYVDGANWSETGWNSGVNWKIYDDMGDNIIYPSSANEWWNTYDVALSNVVMIAGIKESNSNTLSGVVARYLNNSNFLLLEAVRNESKVKMYIRQSGTWSLLDETDANISFLNESVIEYRIECKGNTILGFRNNVQVTSAILVGSELLGTQVGIYCGTSQPNFSYMSATTAP